MMKFTRRGKRYLIGLLAACCSLTSLASDITLYAIHFPPYSIDNNVIPAIAHRTHDDPVYGSDIDIIRAAYASQGIEVAFKVLPWKRIMRDIRSGNKLGIVSCRPIETRKNFAYFSDKISNSTLVMATQKGLMGEQASFPLNILLQHKPVTNAGWAQEVLLTEANIPYTVVNSIMQGATLILHRDRDVFVTDKDTLTYVLNRRGLLDQFSLYEIDDIDYDQYTVCFSRKYPRSEHYRDALNKGLAAIRQSGEMQRIFQRYDMDSVDSNKAITPP